MSNKQSHMQPRIFICVGELSGDILAAGLIQALKKYYPHATFVGVTGPQMQAAGCEVFFSMDEIAAMGLIEVLPKLWRILAKRRQLIQYCLQQKIDLFIGVDAPDFNLPIEKMLKENGIKTAHYVSPSVWAWRSGRVHTVAKAADLLLTILPFEKQYYAQTPLRVEYVGHRAADNLPNMFTQQQAREILQLNLLPQDEIVAILPGSRYSEIQRLGKLFLHAAQQCYQQNSNLKFIVAAANDNIAKIMENDIEQMGVKFACHIVVGKTHAVIKAANVVLVASGTATLETFLLDQPMVVAYKVNTLTAWLARMLLKIKYCALPNLLANKMIVPEFLQQNATSENLSHAILHILSHPIEVERLREIYKNLRGDLQCGADQRAADAVRKLLGE